MSYLKKGILAFVVTVFCISCGKFNTFPKEQAQGLGEPSALKALIDSGQTVGEGKYRIVDVRPEGKFAKGHIPSAMNLPNGKLDGTAAAPPKDKMIIAYCETGGRAQMASKKMAKAGYTQIYNWGGFGKWTYAPAQ